MTFTSLRDAVYVDLVSGTAQTAKGLAPAAGNLRTIATLVNLQNVVGTTADDVILGDAGNNVLTGGAGSDLLDARSGDDTLIGGTGDDVLVGYQGNDAYIYTRGDGNDEIDETVAGPAGGTNDRLVLHGIEAETVSFSRAGGNLLISIQGGAGIADGGITLVGPSNGPFGYDQYGIDGIAFDDGTFWDSGYLSQRAVADTATAGNDVLIGTEGWGTIDGEAGNDALSGAGGTDTMIGGLGNDLMNGGSGGDFYRYARGDGSDVINDVEGNTGNNPIDTLVFADINATDVTLSHVVGSNDLTFLIAESAPGAGNGGTIVLTNEFAGAYENLECVKFADGTVWTKAAMATMLLTGTASNDTLSGFGSADILTGGQGNDTMIGGSGGDTYVYARGDGDDTINDVEGNTGNNPTDRLVFSGVNAADLTVTRNGANNDVTLIIAKSAAGASDGGTIVLIDEFASTYANLEQIQFADGTVWDKAALSALALTGTAGDDTITGFGTNDTLNGHQGSDVLNGGGGTDTYLYARGDGNDTITDGTWNGNGDKLVFAGIDASDVTVTSSGNDLTIHIAESAVGANDSGSVLLRNEFLGTENGVEQIVFANGTIWTIADLASKALTGTAGDDTITGFGTNDTLNGHQGSDVLNGGGGTDTYLYARGDGNDTITDGTWNGNGDRLVFSDVNAGDVTVTRSGANLTVHVAETSAGANDGGTIVLVNELAGTESGIEQIVFADGTAWNQNDLLSRLLIGTDGNDTLTGLNRSETFNGGKGDDTFNSAGGDDTYLYARGDGNDVINEGDYWSGSDKIVLSGINAASVSILRDGAKIKLAIAEAFSGAGDGGSIVVDANFGQDYKTGLEQIVFGDGTTWSQADLLRSVAGFADLNGDGTVAGGNGDVNVASGGLRLVGGNGSDTYFYGAGYGNDTIDENSNTSYFDSIHLVGLNASNVTLGRVGNSLTITVNTTGEVLTVSGQFQDGNGVEQLRFADGSSLDRNDMAGQPWYMGTAGDDIVGAPGNNFQVSGTTFDLGHGNDSVYAAWTGSLKAVYASGDGNDIYRFWQGGTTDDVLQFSDLNQSDVTMSGVGTDLTIKVNATGEIVTVPNQFYDDHWGIARIKFANGTIMNRDAIIFAAPFRGTNGDDTIGTSSSPFQVNGANFDLGLGNDSVYGDWSHSQTVLYGQGNGSDTYRFWWNSDSDNVLKLSDLNASDLTLMRSGNDLLIDVNGTSDTVTITDQFRDNHYGISNITFANNTTWSRNDIAGHLTA